MNYHLALDGKDTGIFPEEELRRRRQNGELTAAALVWREGMQTWLPIDQALGIAPTSSLAAAPKKNRNRVIIPLAIVGSLVVLAMAINLVKTFVGGFIRGYKQARTVYAQANAGGAAGITAASTPVTWPSNALTEVDMQKRRKAFRVRQYVDGYKECGDHSKPFDAEIQQLIELWLYEGFGGVARANTNLSSKDLAEKLVHTPGCDDPIMLTIAGMECVEGYEAGRRYERALESFAKSKYKAYPRLYATLTFANARNHNNNHLAELDTAALGHFEKMFQDGSIRPEDQNELAEIMIQGWGRQFFTRHNEELVSIVEQAGAQFKWLALVLKGRREIDLAWQARGSGWGNTVTSQGWRGFEKHLEAARDALKAAWKIRSDSPIVPVQMMTVALGSSGAAEMRQWFDRAVAIEMDCPSAWSDMRWGLRPRWYGSEQALLAFGINGVNTGRFDTDVPRKLMDAIHDVETDREMLPGHFLFHRADLWPHLQKMYEGYIATDAERREGWRTSYAAVAYFADHYDVARTQLEKNNWQIRTNLTWNWGKDLSLLVPEVAARTGNLKTQVVDAESARNGGNVQRALAIYDKLDGKDTDERTKQFIRYRRAALALEQKLQSGDWVDWLPTSDNDPNWIVASGKYTRLPDGAVQVESGPEGHMIYCRARTGSEIEVQGEVELVHSSSKSFQAGLVMGLPDWSGKGNRWFSFRLKRNNDEGDIISFANEWTTTQVWQKVPLNDTTNTFKFRFHDAKGTAVVNKNTILRDIEHPGPVRVCDADYLVGLGAFNDMNTTTVRYRNVKIRRLRSATNSN